MVYPSRILFTLFLTFIALAPLFAGGRQVIVWYVNALLCGLILIWMSLSALVQKGQMPVAFDKYAVSCVLFFLVSIWALAQSVSLTPAVLHHTIWTLASETLKVPVQGAISVNPDETCLALLRLLTYGSVFWLALQMGRDSLRAQVMLNVIGLSVLVYALYGLAVWSLGGDTFFVFKKPIDPNVVAAPFVHNQTFAAFCGMGCVIFLVLFLRRLALVLNPVEGGQQGQQSEVLPTNMFGLSVLYFLAFAVIFTALIWSHSLLGLLCTLVALIVVLLIYLTRGRLFGRRFGRVFSVLFVGVGLAWALWFFASIDFSGQRFGEVMTSKLTVFADGYWAVSQRTVDGIRDSMWLGTGYGTFSDVFSMYRDDSVGFGGFWDKAHNTYLEVLLELGLPVGLMLFIAVGLLIWTCFTGIWRRRRDSYFAIVGFSVSLLVVLHSFVGFSLQISGFTIVYMAVLGLAVAQSWSQRSL